MIRFAAAAFVFAVDDAFERATLYCRLKQHLHAPC
jgi:hypothetical protein